MGITKIGNRQEKSASANTPAILSSTTATVANASRRGILIQNQGTNTLYVRFGPDASTSVFHVSLEAGTVNDDGSGGAVFNDKYTGVVTIAGTSPRYTVYED